MLQFLHQMFNLFALLRDDPLKPVTPLTNGAIDETLQHFAPLKLWRSPASAGWLSWIVGVDRPFVEWHPKQRNGLDSSPDCLGATCEARWSSHAAGTSVCSWLCVTARRPAADTRARCQRYSCRMWQLLWTITETINTLFLVVSLLTWLCSVLFQKSSRFQLLLLKHLTFHKVV